MGKKLVDPNRLCLGCMRELDVKTDVCPYCKFSVATYERPENSLPLYEILNGKYLIGKVIGYGGFGITYLAWDFYQSKKVCVKEYFPRRIARRNTTATTYTQQLTVSIHYSRKMTENGVDVSPEKVQQVYMKGLESYIHEAEVLSKFYLLPGVVSVRDFFKANRTAYIVMEHIQGMDMKKFADAKGGRLGPDVTFYLMRDIIKALYKVHKSGLIHRDISPDNIMLDVYQQKAKLIDFGATKDILNGHNEPILLKQGYAPPEQYSKSGNLGPWTDVYSLCATMYYLMSGTKVPKVKERLKGAEPKLLQVLGVPIPENQDLAIRKGLSLNLNERYPSMADLYTAIYGVPIDG